MNAILPVVLLLLAGAIGSVEAQDSARSPAGEEGSPSASGGRIRFSLDVDSPFGLRTLVPGQWGELHLRLENGTDLPRDLLCTSYFEGQPELQYGRQVWVPPRARLELSHPVWLPASGPVDGNTVTVHSLVIDGATDREVLLADESGQLRHERSVVVNAGERQSAVIAGWRPQEAVPQDVLDLVMASRSIQGLSTRVSILAGDFLPTDASHLEYLDHIVVADARLTEDSAALGAVRSWLHAGGRLWIMLDRAGPRVMEQLFGDEFLGHLVDRVPLSSVRIDVAPSPAAPDGRPGTQVPHEQPVELARIAVSGMKVWNTVDGWPASLTMDYGQGRVLVTTLSPRGWMKPLEPSSVERSEPASGEPPQGFTVLSPMEELSAYILAKRDAVPIPLPELAAIAQEYVAYEVPSFGLMAGSMIGFLMFLAALAAWLWRTQNLEHFGWAGSLVALLFAVALSAQGATDRAEVPETMASTQFVQAMRGTDDVRGYGATAVYRTRGSGGPVATLRGGKLSPDVAETTGSIRRMITTDLDRYHWDGLQEQAGLQSYSHAQTRTFPDRIVATATLDDRGLIGQIAGLPSVGDSAIVATRQGRLNVTLEDDGRFRARADAVMTASQYVDAVLLSDVADRRRRVLEMLFENRTWANSLEQPLLMTWRDDWDSGFDFGNDLTRQGDALLAVPLEIARPPAGTTMVIPAPFLSYTSCAPPDGSNPSGFWDDNSREWQERSSPSTTWLHFEIPRQLLPLIPLQARIDVEVTGAMGRLEILGVRDGRVVPLDAASNPAGSLSFEIDDPAVLAVSEEGHLTLGLHAGTPAASETQTETGGQTSSGPDLSAPINYWRIEALSMQLSAQPES